MNTQKTLSQKRIYLLLAAICLPFMSYAFNPQSDSTKVPKTVNVITKHSVKIGNVTINYTATVGTLIIHDQEGKPIASFGYIAYTKDGVTDLTKRPVTFAYNGGPGSSSIWLHMGALGPKRVVLDDPYNKMPPPFTMADNNYSILDVTDLVMIDPVGTGISKAVGKAKDKDFWGVDQDIESVSKFIKEYIKKYNRWNSPKYLLGESYGTTRSAGIVDYLQEDMGISVNGVVLVSTILSFNTLSFADGNDLPYILYLPTYAAVAWFHNKLPNKPGNLETFIKQVRDFAKGEYSNALFVGKSLDSLTKDEILNKLHEYTGLSKLYWDRANLRVSEPQFTKELLRNEGMTTGRLDARYSGYSQDLLGEYARYDPQSTAISPAYIGLFMEYYYNQLKAPETENYVVSAYDQKDFSWNWNRAGRSRWASFVNTGTDLQDAMTKNPNLKILVYNGYFDLATPFFATEYTMDHLDLPASIRKNIIMKYYKAGHMMYIHKESLPEFKAAIADFIK